MALNELKYWAISADGGETWTLQWMTTSEALEQEEKYFVMPASEYMKREVYNDGV